MKNFKSIFFLLALVTFAVVGCVKDKGFENSEYGVGDPGNVANKGVSFPLAVNSKVPTGIDAVSITPQIINGLIVASLDNGSLPTSDVKVNFVIDNSITLRYNIENGLHGADSIVPFRPSLYNIPSNTITVKAGSRLGELPITIPSTIPLSLDSSYAVALRIVSNDGGYIIAENLKNLLLVFNLKNGFDGVYKCEFTNYHPSLNSGYTGSTVEVEMRTTAPRSNKIWFTAGGFYAAPAILSGGLTAFGAQEPEYTVSLTNAVTVQNVAAGAVTFYTMSSSWPNNYDPVTRVINVKWGYNNPGGVFNPASTREWTQKLTYLRPR